MGVGWHFVICEGPQVVEAVPDAAGVPASIAETTLLAPYNDLAVERLMDESGSDIAAIFVEPIAGSMGLIEPAE